MHQIFLKMEDNLFSDKNRSLGVEDGLIKDDIPI